MHVSSPLFLQLHVLYRFWLHTVYYAFIYSCVIRSHGSFCSGSYVVTTQAYIQVGSVAVLFRQNNIMWLAFIAGDGVIRMFEAENPRSTSYSAVFKII